MRGGFLFGLGFGAAFALGFFAWSVVKVIFFPPWPVTR